MYGVTISPYGERTKIKSGGKMHMSKKNWLKPALLVLLSVAFAVSLCLFGGCVNNDPKEPELTSIAITKQPDKTEYVAGESFDKTGMVLVIVWSDGSIEEITEGFTVVNQDQPLSESNRTVNFTYEGLSTQLNITVNKPAVKSIAIATNPNKMVYKPGETLATPGLTLSVTYVDGITETVYSGYTVEAHSFVLGENIVIITYGGQSTTLKVQATEDGTIDEPNPPTPPGPEPSGDKKGCGGTMVGGSLALASVSVALACAFVCKKRKIR